MSTRGSTFWDEPEPMDWVVEARQCPFCTVPAMSCGCPTGERLDDLRAQHYDGMGCE